MSADGVLRVVLVALAVANIGLTVWHWFILRRARGYQAATVARLDEVDTLLHEVRTVHGPIAGVRSNGHRAEPAAEVER
jgi:hypothetical protein